MSEKSRLKRLLIFLIPKMTSLIFYTQTLIINEKRVPKKTKKINVLKKLRVDPEKSMTIFDRKTTSNRDIYENIRTFQFRSTYGHKSQKSECFTVNCILLKDL